jgi:signal peptidase I
VKAKSQETSKPKPQNILWEYVKSLGIALILAICIKTSIVEAYKIPSKSMEDTLLVGDFLLANKFLYGSRLPLPLVDIRLPAVRDPKPGDVVIFKFPKDSTTNYIKRCIAVGGQTVEIRNKVVFVDGKRYENPDHVKYEDPNRVAPAPQSPRDNYGPVKVPPGYLFMMGDNRDSSYDSRFWGFVPRDFVLGKAMVIHWSWGTDPESPRWSWSDPLSVGKAFLYNTFHFFSRVRWSRLASVIT